MSFKKYFALPFVLFCWQGLASADVIQLKDQAAVTGKILAEKPDAVVVDVGYTVLVVPRSVIAGISKSGNVAPVTTTPAAPGNPVARVNPLTQFYNSDTRPGAAHDVQDLVKRLGEAVVQVRTPEGLGSGFFINADGYLITNFHVIEGETEISVEVYHQHNGQLDRETYKQVKIIAINKFHDLALLQIEDKNAPKFKFVTLGSSDALSVGDSVFAIGSPMGLERTVTSGHSQHQDPRRLKASFTCRPPRRSTPATAAARCSTSPARSSGVTNMKITFGEGLGFAIPVELVKSFLDHRDAFAYSTDNPNNPYRYLEPPGRTVNKPVEK